MNRLAYFDTNIFLHSDDVSNSGKQALAMQFITACQLAGLAAVSVFFSRDEKTWFGCRVGAVGYSSAKTCKAAHGWVELLS